MRRELPQARGADPVKPTLPLWIWAALLLALAATAIARQAASAVGTGGFGDGPDFRAGTTPFSVTSADFDVTDRART